MSEDVDLDDMIKVSDILSDTYNKIGEALGIEIDNDSEIFHDIEEFIVEKYQEMRDDT